MKFVQPVTLYSTSAVVLGHSGCPLDGVPLPPGSSGSLQRVKFQYGGCEHRRSARRAVMCEAAGVKETIGRGRAGLGLVATDLAATGPAVNLQPGNLTHKSVTLRLLQCFLRMCPLFLFIYPSIQPDLLVSRGIRMIGCLPATTPPPAPPSPN